MENFELSFEDIKQIDKVTAEIKELKNELEGKKNEGQGESDKKQQEGEKKEEKKESDKKQQEGEKKEEKKESDKKQQEGEKKEEKKNNTTQSTESSESNELFYEINDKKVVLKMDIVKSHLEKIKDKEWNDLKSGNAAAWIMAVQIALRSPQIGGESHDKYGKIVIDGLLGSNTKGAVEKFQKSNGLKVDGLPGKETMNKIYDILTGKVKDGEGGEGNSTSSTESGENEKKESDDNGSKGVNNTGNENVGNGKESKEKEPKDTELVSVEQYIPSIKLDMRYATTNNFTGKKVYNSTDAKLRYGTIKKLKEVQANLQKQGLSLKIWDAYRPQSAQEKFKKIVKDPSLVAQGKSDHTRGCCLDVTIVKADGTEIPMPSEFDDFQHKNKCKSDFTSVSGEAKKNGETLQKAMKNAGFKTIPSEWWHFYDSNKGNYGYL